MKITTLKYQSLADVALQQTGQIEALVEIALANGRSTSYVPEPGELVKIPKGINENKQILDYYRAKGIAPVTGFEVATEPQTQLLFENGLFEPGLFE